MINEINTIESEKELLTAEKILIGILILQQHPTIGFFSDLATYIYFPTLKKAYNWFVLISL